MTLSSRKLASMNVEPAHEAEFNEKLDCRGEVFDDDADVVHPETHSASVDSS